MAAEKENYPLIVIGAGPAGLTASIYASRYKISNLIIAEALGGLAFEAHKVCNFPGEREISGMELIGKIQKHAESLGSRIVIDKAVNIVRDKEIFKITTSSGKAFGAKALLLAVGSERRRLGLANEDKFLGKGVSYCATCDAMFYKAKTVAVVGGGNSAHTASLYLAEIAEKVYQIYRRDKLRGEALWVDQLKENEKIEIIYNARVVGLKGRDKLEKIILEGVGKKAKEMAIDGLFIEIGSIPRRDLAKKLSLETDEAGYIAVDAGQKTSRNGIWAAGDISSGSNGFRQIITACSEGAIAAENIFKFLQKGG
jgi:thioredoxin reductase (NADPH)